jgi:Fe-Mn family superoxide dismutase
VKHTLPRLSYKYSALEPAIDTETMRIHHSKHHQAYVDNLNKALTGHPDEDEPLEDILAKISTLPPAIRNNAGGHYNHTFFWKIMTPPQHSGEPSRKLRDAIDRSFGSFNSFKEQFTAAATSRFGSGWAWLIKTEAGLQVVSTPNQDNPLMDVVDTRGAPILGVDVWEHAYYLKYRNKRADYLSNWWTVVNWAEVSRLFEEDK